MLENNARDLTIYDIVKKIIAWGRFLWERRLIVISFCLLGGILGVFYAIFSKPKYEAKITFVLSSDKPNTGLMGLATQFGVDLGGEGSNAFSGDNIITLFESYLLVQRALFQKIEGTNELLINNYCLALKLNKDWKAKERTAGAFPFPADVSKITPVQDSLLKEIHQTIIKNSLEVAKPDKKTSFFLVKTISRNEVFALNLTRKLVDETTKFYIETKTQLARQNLDMLQREADSLRRLLSGSIVSTAAALDRVYGLNPAYQVNRAPVQQGQASVTVLGTAYGEVVKNLELAKITLQKEKPLFQIVDTPSYPLKAKKTGKFYALIIGGFLGFCMVCSYFLVRWVVKSESIS